MEGPSATSMLIAANAWLIIMWVIASTRGGKRGGGDGETTTITTTKGGKGGGGGKGGLTPSGAGMGILEVYVVSLVYIVFYGFVQSLDFLQPFVAIVGSAFWLTLVIYVIAILFFKQAFRFLSIDTDEALMGVITMLVVLIAAAQVEQVRTALVWFGNAIGIGGTI